jgi:hypothetical protein
LTLKVLKLDLEYASIKLSSEIRKALSKLKVLAQESEKRISAKPKEGYLCVLSAIEDIDLETQFISSFQKLFSPIKAYANTPINSVKQFIHANGGVNSSIEKLRDYLTITVVDETDYISIYANSFYGSLLDIKASTSRRHLKQLSFQLPYCAFCWRRVEDSNGYCQVHHPNQSKSSFYKAKSALIAALKYNNSKYLEEYRWLEKKDIRKLSLAKYAFKWTASFASHPRLISRALVSSEISDQNIKVLAGKLLLFSKDEYPQTFKLLVKIYFPDITSWQDFVLKIVNVLDPIESVYWEAKDVIDWMSPDGSAPNIFVILMILQRHEAYQYINSLPRPRGPVKGVVLPSQKIELRKKISDLVQSQKDKGQKLNRAEIARKLNLSRQRVSVLIKELEIQ